MRIAPGWPRNRIYGFGEFRVTRPVGDRLFWVNAWLVEITDPLTTLLMSVRGLALCLKREVRLFHCCQVFQP